MKDDFLDQYKTDNPYRVPSDYFDKKKADLLAIAGEGETKQPAKMRRLYWSLSGVAAALLIGFFLWTAGGSSVSAPDADFSDEALRNYMFSSYQYELNEELLLEEITSEELDEEFGPGLKKEVIEDYLNENYDQSLHYEYL